MDEVGTEHIQVELKSPIGGSITQAGFVHVPTTALESFLGASPDDTDKLTQIADFLRSGKSEFTDIDLLQAARSLETRLGLPQIGQKRVDMLYNYAKLQGQIDGLEKERDSLLRLH